MFNWCGIWWITQSSHGRLCGLDQWQRLCSFRNCLMHVFQNVWLGAQIMKSKYFFVLIESTQISSKKLSSSTLCFVPGEQCWNSQIFGVDNGSLASINNNQTINQWINFYSHSAKSHSKTTQNALRISESTHWAPRASKAQQWPKKTWSSSRLWRAHICLWPNKCVEKKICNWSATITIGESYLWNLGTVHTQHMQWREILIGRGVWRRRGGTLCGRLRFFPSGILSHHTGHRDRGGGPEKREWWCGGTMTRVGPINVSCSASAHWLSAPPCQAGSCQTSPSP